MNQHTIKRGHMIKADHFNTFITTIGFSFFSLSANAAAVDYEKTLQQMTGQNMKIISTKDSAVAGIKELVIANGPIREIIYLSNDGQFLFDGNLMHTQAKQNLTELAKKSMRQELMTTFKKTHKSIDFLPEEMTDHITVFTDIDCGYCRKLHQEIDAYNDLGIGVSYLFFPRAGLNTSSHQKAVNVWCSEDQKAAITQAKSGQDLPPLMCPNPIESQFNLGLGMGLHQIGTPTVVFSDGTLIPGYLPAAKMKQKIDDLSKVKSE